MKKILALLSVTLLLAVTVIGCGKFEPKLAEYNTMYKDTTDTNADGIYPNITVKEVKREDGKIIIDTGSPIENMQYALNNFIAFKAYNQSGDSTDKISAKLEEKDQQGIFQLTIEGMKPEEVKYIEIVSYTIADDTSGNGITFEVK